MLAAYARELGGNSPVEYSMEEDQTGGNDMAAMKPRTGDGPMEAVREGRLIIVRVPLEGGGRLVVSVNDDEAKELATALGSALES